MHGDGYENGQVPLLHVFVRIFGLDPAQYTPFFEKIINQILRLNYAQLICEPVRSENKRLCKVTVNSTPGFNIDCNNIVLAFESSKVS